MCAEYAKSTLKICPCFKTNNLIGKLFFNFEDIKKKRKSRVTKYL